MSLKGDHRYKQEHLIRKAQHTELRQILPTMMEQDKHAGETGEYMARSFYFNDVYRSAYREKSDGVYARKKYQVRVHNCEGTIIYLECKHKQRTYISEELASLRQEEHDSFLVDDSTSLLKREEPIAEELFVDVRTAPLCSGVVADYKRKPYIYDVGTVRTTFDREVWAGRPEGDVFDDKIPTYGVLRPDEMALEIEFTGYLSERTRRLSYINHFTQTSTSKYRLCADKIQEYRQ